MDLVAPSPTAATRKVDPITLEVIRNALISINDQIDTNITRTAYSPLVYEYKDYATGIVDPEGKLICQCTGGMPVFIADVLSAAVRDGLEIYGTGELHPGDVIISNHAGTIGQHLNNMAMYTPVYADEDGADLIAFMVVFVHWLDVGGKVVGSISGTATDIFQEGIQFRTIKLRSKGEKVPEIYRMIEHNTRFPDMVFGDLEAQLAGCLMGRDMIKALIGRYGAGTFRGSVETIWDQSEAAARAAIAAVPDGIYPAGSFLDDDGIRLEQTIPINLVVTIDGDEMTVDLSGIADEVEGPINAGASGGGHTVARIAFKYLIAPDEPANEGAFRPLTLILPDGKILSAGPTAAMSKYNMSVPTAIDTIIKALADAVPDRVAGAHFGSYSSFRIFGRQPVTDELYQMNDSGHGGWGASSDQDGSGPFRTMAHGDTRIIPTEVHEATYPLRIDEFSIRPDSGGPGEFRGGLGLLKRYTILAPCMLATYFERIKCPPWGVRGGGAGKPGSIFLHRRGEAAKDCLKAQIDLLPGDELVVETGGGGGFGPALARDPARVAADVASGYVTVTAAKTDYGIVLDDAGAPLDAETVQARADMVQADFRESR